jgi:hypothetical protein
VLKIRPEQRDALGAVHLASYEERMLSHVNHFFPEQCEALTEEQTVEAIREGIQRAAAYEIVAERDVCKFTDLMFAFGRDFDSNPEYPWAREILRDPLLPNSHIRMDRLFQAAKAHLASAQETG